ncbi:hypothetical protein LTR08_004258 [Meristemomyces frigidus]|nr:hypothetical protein LTR08_004258 [Meristemomyces frigidus]
MVFTVDEQQHGTSSGPKDRMRSAQQTPSVSGDSSTTTEEQAAGTGGAQPKSRHSRTKPRPKTMWVPYPMINHCVLRPSYLQSSAARPHVYSDDNSAFESDDAFPPTFGSSAYGRPSTESSHLAPYSSPRRPASPAANSGDDMLQEDSGRSPSIRIRCRDFQMIAFHFGPISSDERTTDETARQMFFTLRSRCCLEKIEHMLAFHFQPPQEEIRAGGPAYDARKEFARMGIGGKAPEGPGSAWRITDINQDYSFSATYPSVLCVPQAVSDNMLKYGGNFRSRSRIPALSYLHFNGGSITRSSQPMVGVQGKRNPQDERLVSAIFSSHTPPPMSPEGSPPQVPSLTLPSTTTLESSISDSVMLDPAVPDLRPSQSETGLDGKAPESAMPAPMKTKVYGSTRRNLIVDARPKINALANRATGGGIEDVSNYMSGSDVPVEKLFLSIQNIHVMRSSLERVMDSLANSDYVSLPPDQEALRKSGWLAHIAGLMEGSEMVARAVGLTGGHALIHCSDGWDRTSQVSALAQMMLDPYYRTLDGFIILTQKDFLAFGHKFRDRDGILGSEKWFEIENERIAPSRQRENGGSDTNSLNALGTKAFSGAKSWFEKSRGGLFRQQNASHDSLADSSSSRPASPPPNPIIHSPPIANGKDEKEHRTSEKEISPIFHQFLEGVWQLQRQYPRAFEFNERFLLRLMYHTYAGQYGEFLFNSEKERWQHKDQTPSVWPYFLARRTEFTNADYTANDQDSLLLPKRGYNQQIDVQWWSKLFGREDAEMNLPRAPAVDQSPLNLQASSTSFDGGAGEKALATTNGSALREARSTPSLGKTWDSVTASFFTLGMQSPTSKDAATAPSVQRPPLSHQETDVEVLSKYAASAGAEDLSAVTAAGTEDPGAVATAAGNHDAIDIAETDAQLEQTIGDTLGVGSSMTRKQETGRLDFAAFASQNAYNER